VEAEIGTVSQRVCYKFLGRIDHANICEITPKSWSTDTPWDLDNNEIHLKKNEKRQVRLSVSFCIAGARFDTLRPPFCCSWAQEAPLGL